MPLVIPNHGETDALQYFVNKATPQDLVLRLFTNNVTPSESDTAASYTEASGSGYSAITLTGTNWSTPTEGAPSSISYPEQTFSFTGTIAAIYGYYCTRASSGRIVLAERFPSGPYAINSGDSIKITPVITAD